MNKMIHKKTGASFLVVYVIYVSLFIQIARKLRHVYSPDMPSLQLLEGKLKCLLVCIQGGLYLFHYVLDILNWLVFVFLSNLIINLMYTYLQNKRMRRCGVAPPPIIFEKLKLPQQIIYRRKENLSESPNHQKYWENILVSRFYEQFSRNRRNLGHFWKFEKISNS